jgi:quercetin dioxygenase-like cupin family protein
VALHRRGEDVPKRTFQAPQADGGTVSVETQAVRGRMGWLVVATFPPGYHGAPHMHDSEQLNYILEGECWLYINDDAFLMKAGDFARVPPGAIHWSWNRSDRPCTWIEVQTPALAMPPGHAVLLTADGDVIAEDVGPPLLYVDPERYGVAATEAKSG